MWKMWMPPSPPPTHPRKNVRVRDNKLPSTNCYNVDLSTVSRSDVIIVSVVPELSPFNHVIIFLYSSWTFLCISVTEISLIHILISVKCVRPELISSFAYYTSVLNMESSVT